MLKNTIIMLTASLPILAAADEASDSGQYCCPLLPPEPVESCQLPVGYFYPAQYAIRNCGVDLTVAGEFLYWEINEDDVESVGTKLSGTFAGDPNTLVTDFTLLSHQQKYRPGFKIAAGIGFPCFDNWVFDVEYTWFNHRTTNTFNAPGPFEFIETKFVPVAYGVASSALKSERRMNLNFLFGTVGKSFYLSQRLIVKTTVGLKSWWAEEHNNLFFNTFAGQVGTQFTKSGLWGIGPYVTAQIRALLWGGIYIQGKAGVWTTYTRLNKYRVDTNFPAVAGAGFPGFRDVETQDSSPWTVRMFYEGGVGLGWGTYFCNCGYHLDFVVGYDMMTNYVQHYALSVGLANKAFYSQGLSVRAQLDF